MKSDIKSVSFGKIDRFFFALCRKQEDFYLTITADLSAFFKYTLLAQEVLLATCILI
jgi:hypothetical protein